MNYTSGMQLKDPKHLIRVNKNLTLYGNDYCFIGFVEKFVVFDICTKEVNPNLSLKIIGIQAIHFKKLGNCDKCWTSVKSDQKYIQKYQNKQYHFHFHLPFS